MQGLVEVIWERLQQMPDGWGAQQIRGLGTRGGNRDPEMDQLVSGFRQYCEVITPHFHANISIEALGV